MNRLETTIGEPVKAHLDRFSETLTTAMAGGAVTPYFKPGFKNKTQFGEIFTPKRWELVETLKSFGLLTIYALTKRLGRHYCNVHKDVTTLIEWLVIEKDESGKVFVPWDEIAVRCPLLKQKETAK